MYAYRLIVTIILIMIAMIAIIAYTFYVWLHISHISLDEHHKRKRELLLLHPQIVDMHF